jgi:hypothetical protein
MTTAQKKSSTPRLLFTPRKDPVPIVQEAGCAPGPVWTGGKTLPTGIRSPDRSQSLYRLSYPAHILLCNCISILKAKHCHRELIFLSHNWQWQYNTPQWVCTPYSNILLPCLGAACHLHLEGDKLLHVDSNTLRTGLLNCLNARSRVLNFRHRASYI